MKNDHHPAFRARRVADGKCTRCLVRDPRPGKRTCQRCIDVVMAFQARRKERGLCRSCGSELQADRKSKHLCLDCGRVKSFKVSERRAEQGLVRRPPRPCLICREPGHLRKTCPRREVVA